MYWIIITIKMKKKPQLDSKRSMISEKSEE